MTRKRSRNVVITGPEVDVDREIVLDSKGRRIDRDYIERALSEVEEDIVRRAGRPSLTGRHQHSPHVSFRVTPELKTRAEQAARARGITVSQLAREAFERFLAS